MFRATFLAFALILPGAARSDVVADRVITSIILPGTADFADKTKALAYAAQDDCTAEAMRGAWNAAMDSWFKVQDLRFGPLDPVRATIAYWPDSAGHRPRALARLLSGADPALQTPDAFNQASIAARGLYALEAMLYDPRLSNYGKGDPGCALVQAASTDLAQIAKTTARQWRDDFIPLMRSPGAAGNDRFLDASEVRQVMFTALLTSIQFDVLERLGLPLGTFDKPRPKRAEGRLSGRSQRNLELSLAGHDRLARALVPDTRDNITAREDFKRLDYMLADLNDPVFAGVDDPTQRFKLEALQTAFSLLREEVNTELSAALGVSMGLNALDGD